MKIILGILLSTLMVFSITSFANDESTKNAQESNGTPKTSMKSDWVCTTNASSSDVAKDQEADKKMSETAGAAAKSFAFSAKHCRDCTQITCNVKK